jgi:hypothetical protein
MADLIRSDAEEYYCCFSRSFNYTSAHNSDSMPLTVDSEPVSPPLRDTVQAASTERKRVEHLKDLL